eukprot:2311559-Pyramimonas_sp.AAC.1
MAQDSLHAPREDPNRFPYGTARAEAGPKGPSLWFQEAASGPQEEPNAGPHSHKTTAQRWLGGEGGDGGGQQVEK